MSVPFVDLEELHRPITMELEGALQRVVAHGRFILGPEVGAFEEAFAGYCGVRYAVGVGSGLDALALTLRAAGLSPGAEVVVPANTFVATALAVIEAGGVPVPADVLPDTYNLDPAAAAAAVTPRTEALLPVHLYGQPADMDGLRGVADRHRLLLLEDAAQAHGARYRGRRAGFLGHAGCFSFYPAKNLGAFGDAGAVITNDAALAERLRELRDYGQREKNLHLRVGVNSRLDTLQAAVLLAKLPHLDRWNAARREAARIYRQELGQADVVIPLESEGAEHVYHLYVIQVSERERVRRTLAQEGIATQVHYPCGLADHPAFASRGWRPGDYPVTERLTSRVLSLPMFPGLDRPRIGRVARAIHEALRTATLPS